MTQLAAVSRALDKAGFGNVTVRRAGGHTLVQAVDPAELLAMAGDGGPQPAGARRRRPRRLRQASAPHSTP